MKKTYLEIYENISLVIQGSKMGNEPEAIADLQTLISVEKDVKAALEFMGKSYVPVERK